MFLAYVCLVAQLCLTLCDPMDCSLPCSSVHEDSPGKNTGVGCHFFLQGIFPAQELNQGLLHCRHQRSPYVPYLNPFPDSPSMCPTKYFIFLSLPIFDLIFPIHFPSKWAVLSVSTLKGYSNKKGSPWSSLVIQWLRIHLPMQGTWLLFLVRKIPHAVGQLSSQALELVLLYKIALPDTTRGSLLAAMTTQHSQK